MEGNIEDLNDLAIGLERKLALVRSALEACDCMCPHVAKAKALVIPRQMTEAEAQFYSGDFS